MKEEADSSTGIINDNQRFTNCHYPGRGSGISSVHSLGGSEEVQQCLAERKYVALHFTGYLKRWNDSLALENDAESSAVCLVRY